MLRQSEKEIGADDSELNVKDTRSDRKEPAQHDEQKTGNGHLKFLSKEAIRALRVLSEDFNGRMQ